MLRQLEPAKCRGTLREEYWEDNNQWIAEFKFDGARYLMHIGAEGSRFTSRRKSVKDGLYVEKRNFPHLENICEPEDTVLDGEFILNLYGSSYDSTTITGSAREVALKKQEESGFLSYMVFDILFLRGIDMRSKPLQYRKTVLEKVVLELDSTSIVLSKCYTTKKNALYCTIVKKGGEGVVLKHIQSMYGERQKWVKVKKKETWDVVILGYKKPSELSEKVDGSISVTRYKNKGWIGAIEFGQYYAGKLVPYGTVSGMDETIRSQISCYPDDYVGKVIEIEAQERLKSGSFRHPRFVRFREDKEAKDCEYATD